jgi:hypothetical protein
MGSPRLKGLRCYDAAMPQTIVVSLAGAEMMAVASACEEHMISFIPLHQRTCWKILLPELVRILNARVWQASLWDLTCSLSRPR